MKKRSELSDKLSLGAITGSAMYATYAIGESLVGGLMFDKYQTISDSQHISRAALALGISMSLALGTIAYNRLKPAKNYIKK